MNIHKNDRLTPLRREEMAVEVLGGRLLAHPLSYCSMASCSEDETGFRVVRRTQFLCPAKFSETSPGIRSIGSSETSGRAFRV